MPSNFSGDPNSLLTYASPSTKWILGANGIYQSGTTLRTEYDAAGLPLGVRIEDAMTNLILRSQEFDTAQWTKGGVSVGANAAASPDGTVNADTLIASAASSAHSLTQAVTISTGTVYTYSVYAKAAGYSWLCLEGGGGAGSFTVWFDLGAGTVGTVSNATSASIVNVGGGWYRCSVLDTSTGTSGNYRIYVTNANGVQTFLGDGTSGVHIWQAQLEAGSAASSPIVTAGSTVTRAVDSIKIAKTGFPWNGGAGTLTIDGVVTSPTTDATHLLVVPRSGQTHIQTFKWVPA